MRSPWNNNPSGTVGRYNRTYYKDDGSIPDCSHMSGCFDKMNYKNVSHFFTANKPKKMHWVVFLFIRRYLRRCVCTHVIECVCMYVHINIYIILYASVYVCSHASMHVLNIRLFTLTDRWNLYRWCDDIRWRIVWTELRTGQSTYKSAELGMLETFSMTQM